MRYENWKDLKPFARGKNATMLGIDLKRKFVVVKQGANDEKNLGEVIKLKEDDETFWPWFIHTKDVSLHPWCWSQLAYLPEEAKEEATKKKTQTYSKEYIKARDDEADRLRKLIARNEHLIDRLEANKEALRRLEH
ncbi:MAG: hypothetical protein WC455_10395 [Dehalococcoidia bacterium]|jgi:hypothetical protein